MIRVLHIIGSLERAGVQSFVMNLYRSIDRSKIQFDFAIYNSPSEYSYADEAKKLGAKIFLIPPKNKGFLKNYRAIKYLVQNEGYGVVWRGCSNCFAGLDLIAAKAGGARRRILHSHSSRVEGLNLPLHYLSRMLCNAYATDRLSCSENAGHWMFGKRVFRIIPNGIDTRRFRYNEEVRNQYRKAFHVSDRLVIGSVARFEDVKNHSFMLDVFSEFNRKHGDSTLFLIGDGPLQGECKEKANKLGLEKNVRFLGRRTDVAELMQMMDVFFMPSKYEGFPVTLVEAQTAGLPCVVSDVVSNESNVSGCVRFVGLGEPIEMWCDAFSNSIQRNEDAYDRVVQRGFDIKDVCALIEHILAVG